jgi:hypothetical protein
MDDYFPRLQNFMLTKNIGQQEILISILPRQMGAL